MPKLASVPPYYTPAQLTSEDMLAYTANLKKLEKTEAELHTKMHDYQPAIREIIQDIINWLDKEGKERKYSFPVLGVWDSNFGKLPEATQYPIKGLRNSLAKLLAKPNNEIIHPLKIKEELNLTVDKYQNNTVPYKFEGLRSAYVRVDKARSVGDGLDCAFRTFLQRITSLLEVLESLEKAKAELSEACKKSSLKYKAMENLHKAWKASHTEANMTIWLQIKETHLKNVALIDQDNYESELEQELALSAQQPTLSDKEIKPENIAQEINSTPHFQTNQVNEQALDGTQESKVISKKGEDDVHSVSLMELLINT